MRAIFGVISLLIALFVVVGLAKKQLGSMSLEATRQRTPLVADLPFSLPIISADKSPLIQSQTLEQQIKQSIEAAMQQSRQVPEDKE